MSITFNKVILIGRLTRDPELKMTPNGTKVANFSLAVDRGYRKNENSEYANTDFFRIVGFNALAEFVTTYFKKGRLVLVEGSLRINKYKDKNDMQHEIAEIWAISVKFMESKKKNDSTEITNDDDQTKKIESIDDDILSADMPEFDFLNELNKN